MQGLELPTPPLVPATVLPLLVISHHLLQLLHNLFTNFLSQRTLLGRPGEGPLQAWVFVWILKSCVVLYLSHFRPLCQSPASLQHQYMISGFFQIYAFLTYIGSTTRGGGGNSPYAGCMCVVCFVCWSVLPVGTVFISLGEGTVGGSCYRCWFGWSTSSKETEAQTAQGA